MKAPNGKDTNLNEKQWVQVRTRSFKNWFGDWENNPENSSKVVDENGEPKVVQHGTPVEELHEFDISHLGDNTGDNGVYGAGFYFGNLNKHGFSMYGDNIIQAYLNLKKPYNIDADSDILNFINSLDFKSMREVEFKGNSKKKSTIGDLIDYIKEVKENYDKGEYSDMIEEMKSIFGKYAGEEFIMRKISLRFAFPLSVNTFINNCIGGVDFSSAIKKNGNDGVVVWSNGNHSEFVALYPNQIKSATENNGSFDPNNPDIRFREEESDGSREEYERSLQGWKYKAREAYQDSMLALKNLKEVIAKVSGKPIKSFEDAYTFENQLSSKNTSESEKYYDEFFVPLLNAEGKLIKKYGLTHKAIERYMMLAHGIERNVEMTFREQLNEIIKENPDDAQQFIQDFKDEKEKLRAKYSGYEYLKALSDYMGEVGDFSATEAILKSMDNEEHADFQSDALDYVKDFENMYDVKELWEKTNKATKETLEKSYESGMMDKDHFANVSKMFMYYVPLRGWTEDTAEDVYEYINSERNPVNSVLKSMKGRKSVPDEVIATIGNMAESSILQGNRNLMKQAFMNMVVNHPTDWPH